MTNCHQLKLRAADGKLRYSDVADLEQMLRLVQSIPSKKAEPIKRWLAELTTTNITKEEHPQTMSEHAQVAERGGSVARVAKEAFEQQTGKKVVSSLSMKQYVESQQPKLDLEDEQ